VTIMKNIFALAVLLCAAASHSRSALCQGDVLFSARFYNSPQKSKGRANSRAHLFRVDASGANRRQISDNAHDDQTPRWSPDGQRITFVRDGESICVSKADGSGVKVLSPLLNLPQWSPDSREIGVLDDGSHTLFFINVRSGKKRSLQGVEQFAWSPNGQQLAWKTTAKTLCITNLGAKTQSRTYTPLEVSTMAWAAPQVLVAATGKLVENTDSGLDTFVMLDTNPRLSEARVLKTFPVRATLPASDGAFEGEQKFADWRSQLLPIPGARGQFAFRWDNTTSSGRDGFFFHASTQNGALKLLAHGQNFAFEPGGKRFVWAPYHELAPYNVPGERPKWVYTSPLKMGDGRSTRTLVSGLVLIYGCDWR
jgi:dipeptidyl aminopeptidase/acylaminoacyl peptidase